MAGVLGIHNLRRKAILPDHHDKPQGGFPMARFMVERSFPDGLEIPLTEQGAQACLSVVGTNAELGVTWVHSYVTEDHKKTFCIYDAPSPEAIRKAAKLNQLPADAITPVRVLDPYFYR